MKGYIKYILLFIVLIGIGMLGINLYSKETLKETEKNNTLAQNTEKKQEESKENNTKKEEEKELEVDTKNSNETTTNSTSNTSEKETSKGYINIDTNTTQQTGSAITNPTDLTVSSSNSNTEPQKEETITQSSPTNNFNTNNTTSSVATISEEDSNSFHVIEVDPKVYSSTTNQTITNSNNTSNNTTTKENVITVTIEEEQTSPAPNSPSSPTTSTSPQKNTTNSSSSATTNSSSNTTNKKNNTTPKTTNNLSNLEKASSYNKIKVFKTLTSKDLTKKVSVVGNNGSGIAQSFCVAGNNYITAQINSANTRTLIQVYDKKTGKKKNSIVSNFHHANGMTYNKNTNSIYLVHLNNSKYSVFSNNNIETTTKLNSTTNKFPKSISGIAYDEATNQYYAAQGSNIYVYDANFKLIRTIKKLRSGISQDIGAYKGIILVIVYQPNNSAANNAIDLYRASDGAYVGTYNLKFSKMELESIDYSGNGNTFSLYFNRLGKSTDYIYTTNKIDLK